MTLKEFAEEAGVEIIECDKERWGGEYGYRDKDWINSSVNGFKSKKACYDSWFYSKFGEKTAKALMKLLEKEKK